MYTQHKVYVYFFIFGKKGYSVEGISLNTRRGTSRAGGQSCLHTFWALKNKK